VVEVSEDQCSTREKKLFLFRQKTTTCDVGEDKIGRFLVKNARDRHVGGMPSKLPENVDGRFILLVFETSRG
jgi:hypothetical protein